MKKLRLLLVAFGLLMAIVSTAQQITWGFANPKIVRTASVDYFEFDVQVKGTGTTYLFTGQIILNFDNSILSTNPAQIGVTRAPALLAVNTGMAGNPKYTLPTPTITGSPSVLNIAVISDLGVFPNGPNPDDYIPITSTYQNIVHVKWRIITNTGVSGVNFITGSMDGQTSFVSAPSVYTYYSTPSLYEPADFTNTYVARLYSSPTGWTQVGGVTAWTSALNTSIWDGNATLPLPAITGSPANASAIRIHTGATLTIPPTGQLTAASLENNTANGLTIQSDATGTGSLITGSASGAGTALAQRYMTTGAWHMVSSPLSGQSVANFLTANADIPTNGSARGMMDYIPATNSWNSYFTNATTGDLGAGKGFSVRVGASSAAVTFNGALQTGSQPVAASTTFWNCIGNPYTSAIGITAGSTSTAKFLDVNASNFTSPFGAIYIWNQPDASNGKTGNYTAVSNVPGSYDNVQQGQAFFVNAAVSPLSFTPAMQIHNTAITLKSTEGAWPTIKLEATFGEQKSSTIIAFNNAMTNGLDPTYDAGLLKGPSDLVVYTRLVQDIGSLFAIQALPANDYSSMIIPVGLDFKTGGEVVFSSELINLPSDCKVVLEDKLLKTFTDLSLNVYKTTIAANSSVDNRFQIHTSNQTTGLGEDYFTGKLSAWAVRNINMYVKGNVSNQAIATLYDVQGRVVLTKKLDEGSMNTIRTPNLKTGIYMLFVKDNDKIQGFKIPVKE